MLIDPRRLGLLRRLVGLLGALGAGLDSGGLLAGEHLQRLRVAEHADARRDPVLVHAGEALGRSLAVAVVPCAFASRAPEHRPEQPGLPEQRAPRQAAEEALRLRGLGPRVPGLRLLLRIGLSAVRRQRGAQQRARLAQRRLCLLGRTCVGAVAQPRPQPRRAHRGRERRRRLQRLASEHRTGPRVAALGRELFAAERRGRDVLPPRHPSAV